MTDACNMFMQIANNRNNKKNLNILKTDTHCRLLHVSIVTNNVMHYFRTKMLCIIFGQRHMFKLINVTFLRIKTRLSGSMKEACNMLMQIANNRNIKIIF